MMEFMEREIEKFLTANLGAAKWEMMPIKKGGSDRAFFRVSLPDGKSFIFMQYGTEVAENLYWARINSFLTSIGVSVPAIIAHDPARHFILIEDLGDIDLWSLRKKPWPERRDYYQQVLQAIYKLHTFPPESLPAEMKLAQGYDTTLYQWEHNYFLDNCVSTACRVNIEPTLKKELDKELTELISRLQKIPLSLIHRDFQSQNILIKDGHPVLIDFQGMRTGNFFYDLASLLFDPYVDFVVSEQNELLQFYHQLVQKNYTWDEFKENFSDAAAQRLMQALGAYGFLGLTKKKPAFLQYIEPGLKNLIAATAHSPHLSALHELAIKCQNVQKAGTA
jgi:aminoglycoside/choline kinase family phosphotransferase